VKTAMRGNFCFIYAVFFFCAVLILVVHLRSANDRLLYRLCRVYVEQNRLKQQLWEKQLELESLISPASVVERFER